MGLLQVSREAPDGTQRHRAWDPALKSERKAVLKKVLLGFALIIVAQWTILSIYFGSYFRQTENAYRLTVRILDLDSQYAQQTPNAPQALLGPAVVQAARTNAAQSPGYHLGWQIADAEELSTLKLTQDGQGLNASEYGMNLVLSQDVWAVIVVNANATLLATEAAQQGIAEYDPRGAISFYYEEARNFYSANQYVAPHSTRLMSSAIAQATEQFVTQLLSSASQGGGNTAGALAALTTASNGRALSYPFWYNEHNLRPFDQLAGEAATTAGEIYLIIFTFFSSPIWLKAFEPTRRRLTIWSQMLLQWGVPVACYFWISLNYSLVTLAFHVDFTRKYSYAGFPLFWATNFTGMTGLGLVMETMLRLVGPLFFPFFLIFWVVWNVSTAFLDLANIDHFYLYGHAFPVWNSVDAAKSIIFGTKDHLVQNFIVNVGWVIGGSIALLTTAYYKRHQEDKQELQNRIGQLKQTHAEKGNRDARQGSSPLSRESSDATRTV